MPDLVAELSQRARELAPEDRARLAEELLASAFPEIGSPHRYGTRRVFPKRFPFSVVYQVTQTEVVVLAVAPFPRKPAYWRQRKGGV